MFKKSLAMFIAIIMILQINVFASEGIDDKFENYNSETQVDDEFYLYEDDYMSVAIQNLNNGNIVAAMYNKETGELKEYTGDKNNYSSDEILLKIKSNEIEWDKDVDENIEMLGRVDRTDEARRVLEQKRGPEYFNRIICRVPFDNNTCRVYEDKTQEVYYDTDRFFKAGASLASIVAFTSFKASTLMGFLAIGKGAYDAYVLLKDTFIERYVANEHFWREAKINGKTYITAGLTIVGTILWSDYSGLDYSKVRERGGGEYFLDCRKMAEDSIYQYQVGY